MEVYRRALVSLITFEVGREALEFSLFDMFEGAKAFLNSIRQSIPFLKIIIRIKK